ncbi:hypothetical protein SESBI_10236 [Sesbania bispinosa]|nr:hypothetical protein SESBI_10236 [Sesbania bispinosa]
MNSSVDVEIVIVGGGICGLATALALHRKRIRCLVLERSEKLRATGAAIIVQANGWRALDQLGVASTLRQTAIQIQGGKFIPLSEAESKEIPFGISLFLKRTDLMNAIANSLPEGTIRTSCQVVSIELDPITHYPQLMLSNGSHLRAKVVIGCDGVNSITANIVGLHPTKLLLFSTCVARGFTNYPNGHQFASEFVVMSRGNVQLGRIPVTDKLVYWFVTRLRSSQGYRPPWELFLNKFRKGTVTVAGDAMHVTGPFIAQGGSASLEDAVVLARCLAQKMNNSSSKNMRKEGKIMEEAFDQYVKERKMRILRLSLHSFLIGKKLDTKSLIVRFVILAIMVVLFRDPNGHTYYDCGTL